MTSTMANRQNYHRKSREAWTNWKPPNLGNFKVSPGFAYNIARCYPSTTQGSDKDLSKELMYKLGLSPDPAAWYRTVTLHNPVPRRPPSAPPGLRKMDSWSQNPEKFYMTTHKKEFTGLQGTPAFNARPSSAKIFPSRLKYEETTYGKEFSEKALQTVDRGKVPPRNKPHPSQAFMTWKFSTCERPELDPTGYNTENIEEISYDQLKTTYQNDYTGIPQGVQIQTVFEGDLQAKLQKPPYTLDSTTRSTYQKPVIYQELQCPTLSRYGCNKNKYKATVGAVPTVSVKQPQMHLSGRTEYTDEYKNRFSQIREPQIRYKSGPIPALEEFLKHASKQERDSLVNELEQITRKDNRETRPPQWHSEYPGPT